MEYQDKQRLIHIISCGKVFAQASRQGESVDIVLVRPSSDDLAIAALEYEKAYNTAVSLGSLRRRDLLVELNEREIWTSNDESILAGLQSDLKKLRRGLLDYFFQKDRLEKIRQTIRKAEEALMNKIMDKEGHLKDSVEAYALNAQQAALVKRITQYTNGALFWENESDFSDEQDVNIVQDLVNLYFNLSVTEQSVIRELARTDPWRSIWCAGKKNGSLFDGSVCGWTQNQLMLSSWSNLYDSVYEAYERPSSAIIEDDDLLDSWLIREQEKSDASSKKQMTEKAASTTSKKDGRQEVFIVTDAKGAKDVYEANDPVARKSIQTRQRLISQQGSVKEEHMPDSQAEMRMKMVTDAVQRTKSISRRG